MKRINALVFFSIHFLLLSCMPVTPQIETNVPAVPTIIPSDNSYTGIQEVDTIVNALLAQDVARIVSQAQFIQLPCTNQSGLGGPPRCEEGQEEGTVVEVFPIGATHGTYLTPDTIHELKPNVTELYAVYEVPDDTNLGIDWPIGQYGLVFRNADPVPHVITVFIADGNIVRIGSNFVESPEQALPESAHILYRQTDDTKPNSNASLAVSVGPPQTLDELISQAPLIFIGEVGPVVQYLDFAVYGDDGQLIEQAPDAASSPLPPVPATDFVLQVEEVLRDDGAVASGEPIILRMPGTATAEMKELTQAIEYPFSYTGDRHLFLLGPNPDAKSYGFYYGPWSRLIIDGEILRVSDGEQQFLQFDDSADPVTLEEFIQQVKSP